MFAKSFAVVFAAAAALAVSALDIATPAALTQCGTVAITWSGKNAPFILSVLPSCDSNSDVPIAELPPMNATSYNWTVNLPSSTGVIAFAITDAEGNEAYTDEVTINKSNDAACLNASASSSSASASTSATSSASSVISTEAARTTLVVSSTSATATPSAPANVGGSASSSSGSSSNQSTSGAATHAAPVFAGVIGLATGLLALF